MNVRRFLTCAVLAIATLVTAGGPTLLAQAAATTPQPTRPVDPTSPTAIPMQEPSSADRFEQEFGFRRRYWRPVLRVGQDFTLRANERVRSVTVAFGRAKIEGRVEGDLAVIFGPVTLASTAVVEGSFVVVGGNATVEPGAIVRDDVVVIGAGLDVPENFYFGGQHMVIGTRQVGAWMESMVPWITGGLLLGRPIVPSVPWVWSVLALFFIVYLMVNLLAHEPVGEAAAMVAVRPLGSFMTGLLTLLLAGPVSALLAVSIIGIAVIPFALAALVVAGVVGRVGVLRWIGNSVITPDDGDSRLQGARSFVIGFVLLTLVYMVPVFGFVVWALFGVLGLGAAVLAFLTAWRKEHPKPEKPARAPKVNPVPTPTPPATPAPTPAPIAFAGVQAEFAAPPVEPPAPASPPASPPAGGAAAAAVFETALFPRASFLDRAAAFVLDIVLVMFIVQVLHPVFYYRGDNFFLTVLLAYFIGFWTWKGTTIGGIVTNLRVVKVGGGELAFPECLVRGLMGVLSFGALAIGVLWILKDEPLAADGLPTRQAWHDLAVGTYVVKVPKGHPLP